MVVMRLRNPGWPAVAAGERRMGRRVRRSEAAALTTGPAIADTASVINVKPTAVNLGWWWRRSMEWALVA